MTGAHLGGRGAGRRRSYSATAAPAWSAGVAAMVMGATMWIFGARFFGTFWQRTRDVKKCDRFVLMDQTERFLTGPNFSCAPARSHTITANSEAGATRQAQEQQAAKQALQSKQHSNRNPLLLPTAATPTARRRPRPRARTLEARTGRSVRKAATHPPHPRAPHTPQTGPISVVPCY